MRRFALPSLGVTVLLAGSLALVSSAAYASTSATAPQTLAVQPGTLFVSNTTQANITAPVDGSGSGTLPTALWGDTTGTGDGWQGSVAASNFIYTGQWTPTGSAPALGSSSSASYTGSADGDTYTVSVTGVSGSTISFSYSSQNGATGTGTATAGTAADVGTNGLTITFSSSTTYSTGDEYQIQVGSQNKNALTLADGGSPASVAPYQGTTSTAPTFVNQTAAVTGGGSTYGAAVPILSASTYTGMGEYTVKPAATVNTDINSWAATYTGQIQYTIASGPSSSVGAPPLSGTTSGDTLISTQDITYDGSLQTISVPSGTKYAVITAAGGGGGGGQTDSTYGGGGDLISANVPISTSSLVVLVGGGGQTIINGSSGGGGGLSGVFVGTPSDADALIIAGGGGGGANDNLQNTQSNGTDGSLSPILPYNYSDGASGGAGFGGGGGLGDIKAGNDGTAFGAGGASSGTYSTPGGFGGGASGGDGWGGGGGGSGYVGGQGGNGWSGLGAADNGSGGQGGQSYVISKATHVVDTPGNGGAGGFAANGGNGYVDISFYGTTASTSTSYTPSGAPNIPILVGDTKTLEPGWTANGGLYASGSSDGGRDNGDATFSFTVGSGESTTITYGIPAGGYVNNSDATITVNGTTVATITNDTGQEGVTASTLENLWTQTFGPGTYTIGISTSGSINVYGLWASNLSAVTPS